MKKIMVMLAIALGLVGVPAMAADMSNGADNFYKSDRVTIQKISFKNKIGMKVVGNLFTPKNLDQNRKYAAIVVGHPMGAVKEQSANLYATKLAEQGFVTLDFDLSFWGESEGEPRNTVSTDIYVDDFLAAVDFLGTQTFVDRGRIGALGICASGSFVVSAAQIDPRIRAIATVSMYDMGAANRNGLHHSVTLKQREKILQDAAQERTAEFSGAPIKYTSGTPEKLTKNSTVVEREFYDFYRTPRGYSPNTTTHPTLVSNVSFMNFYPFEQIQTISPRHLLFVAGEKAHSREFSEDAYQRAAEPKELYIVPGAGHVDLYDRTKLIPFAKLADFFRENLK